MCIVNGCAGAPGAKEAPAASPSLEQVPGEAGGVRAGEENAGEIGGHFHLKLILH